MTGKEGRNLQEPRENETRREISRATVAAAVAGLLSILYLIDVGNVRTGIDHFFNQEATSAHAHTAMAAAAGWLPVLLPFAAIAGCLVALYVLLAAAGVGRGKHTAARLNESMTAHEFAEMTLAKGIGPRVAREMYRTLQPKYGKTLRSTMECRFEDMGLSTEAVWAMFEALTVKSGGVVRGRVGVEQLGTPMEMMQVAEQCVARAASERRAQLHRASAAVDGQQRAVISVPVAGRR